MTKAEVQERLTKILESMIGEDVVHSSFGLGTIIGFENNKCIVKYDSFKEPKVMSTDRFFTYHEPVSETTIEEINALKCEYDLSKDKNNIKKVQEKVTEVETENKEVEDTTKKITFEDVIGLDNVIELINQMVVYPFKYTDIYKAFKRDSGGGILLYGAPGTGKTMIAKAIQIIPGIKNEGIVWYSWK